MIVSEQGSARISGDLKAQSISLQNGAKLQLEEISILDQLTLGPGATLSVIETIYEDQDPTEVHADAIHFSSNSTLQAVRRSWTAPVGAVWDFANLYATNLTFGSSTNGMNQHDLDSIATGLYDYLVDYSFNLSSGPTGQHIRVSATGIPLAEKTDNPLPAGVTILIDEYRSVTNRPYEEQNRELELMLLSFAYEPMRARAQREYGRYFETAAAPMVLQAVQAGQQAQLNQVLGHISTQRKAGSSAPVGPGGPAVEKDGWNGWIKGYYTDATKDPDGDFYGYDADIAGMVIGVERSSGQSLIGLAGGSANTDVDTEEPGTSSVDTYFGTLYGSLGKSALYVDASLSYGFNKVASSRGSLTHANAEYDAHTASGYLGMGKEYGLSDRLILTPELGGLMSYYYQESYTETGVLANTYDEYDHWTFISILGLDAALELPAGESWLFKPELKAHWRHDFNNDPGRINYSTEGSGTGTSASLQSPEKDTLIIGAAVSTLIHERLEIILEIDQQLADGWEATTYSGVLKFNF